LCSLLHDLDGVTLLADRGSRASASVLPSIRTVPLDRSTSTFASGSSARTAAVTERTQWLQDIFWTFNSISCSASAPQSGT
jgi:hypothetical protein